MRLSQRVWQQDGAGGGVECCAGVGGIGIGGDDSAVMWG